MSTVGLAERRVGGAPPTDRCHARGVRVAQGDAGRVRGNAARCTNSSSTTSTARRLGARRGQAQVGAESDRGVLLPRCGGQIGQGLAHGFRGRGVCNSARRRGTRIARCAAPAPQRLDGVAAHDLRVVSAKASAAAHEVDAEELAVEQECRAGLPVQRGQLAEQIVHGVLDLGSPAVTMARLGAAASKSTR